MGTFFLTTQGGRNQCMYGGSQRADPVGSRWPWLGVCPHHLIKPERLACPCGRPKKKGPLSGPDSKESACNAGDPGSIPRSGRSLGEGNGKPLQDSCLKNPVDRGPWQAPVQGSLSRHDWVINPFTFKHQKVPRKSVSKSQFLSK